MTRPMIPGEIETRRGRHRRSNDGPRGGDADGRQHRRPADPGRLALPLRRDQRRARLRPRRGAGMRLDIAAGTAVRFEPGQRREVSLVPYAGDRVVHGFNGRVGGPL